MSDLRWYRAVITVPSKWLDRNMRTQMVSGAISDCGLDCFRFGPQPAWLKANEVRIDVLGESYALAWCRLMKLVLKIGEALRRAGYERNGEWRDEGVTARMEPVTSTKEER